MIYFLAEVLIIVAYLFNPYYGLIASLITYAAIFFNRKYTIIDKIIISLLVSLPTFNISIIGDKLHHVFSWNIIFTMFFIIVSIFIYKNNKTKHDKKTLFIIFAILISSFIHCFFDVSFTSSLIEWFQCLLVIMPILLAYYNIDYINGNTNKKEEYIDILNNIILATACCVIFQCILYYKFNILVGNWTFYPGRVSIDLLFKGASVLSLFIGISIPINIYKMYNSSIFKYVIFLVICIIAILLNSARTGLVAGILCSIPIFIKQSLKNKKTLFISMTSVGAGALVLKKITDIMLKNRGTANIMSENGRFLTYKNGINQIFSSFSHFMFGSGLSIDNYTFTLPHNLILETIMTYGFINFVLLFILFVKVIKITKDSQYKYMMYVVYVGSMFITNFFGNNFIIIITILLIIDSINNKQKERNY